MAQVYKDAKGNYVALTSDGRQVPVLPSLAAGARVTGFSPVLQEQGVSGFQRFTAKNLTKNPEIAQAYLEKIGYEVRPYGDGFNFAVRPKNGRGSTPWKVVDPDGFDPQDLLDFASDAISIGAQSIAAVAVSPSLAAGPAGMATEAAAVGGTAAVMEGARQAAGAAAGVPSNLSVSQIGIAGAGGAVSVPVGRGLSGAAGAVGRAVGRMARGVGARFAGIEGSRALPGADALLDAAEWSVAHPGQLMRTPEQAAEIVRDAVKAIAKRPFPEKQAAMALAGQAAQAGHTLNVRPLVDSIQAEMAMPTAYRSVPNVAKQVAVARTPELQVKHAVDPGLQQSLEDVMATVYALVGNDSLAALPLDRAVLIKNYLQQVARQKGAYMQTPPGRAFRDLTTNAARELKEQIETAMTNAGFTDYVPTMRAFEVKTGLLHDWSKALSVKDRSAAAHTKRVAFVKALYSDAKTNWLSALDDLETTFGVTGLKTAVREAAVGRVTGMSAEGGPSLLGRGPRSTLGLGALVFGHPAVAGVELAVTSPKVVMGATKAGIVGGKTAGSLVRGGLPPATIAAAHATGKAISRDDQPKPTRLGM